MAGTKRDPSTQANYDIFLTRKINANFTIDFSKKILKGGVILTLEVVGKGDEIILDTSHLDLSNIVIDGTAAQWELEPRSKLLGSALRIKVGKEVDVGKTIDVAVSENQLESRNWGC